MKGIIFHQGIEIQLITHGEQWRQGDKIKGQLVVKSQRPLSLQLHLAQGQFKDVHSKKDKWKIIQSQSWEDLGEKKEVDWEFKLDMDCPVTDKNQSLYLLYGLGDAKESWGQLQLQLLPHLVIEQFLKTFELFFRFKIGTMKCRDNYLAEVKLTPPAIKDYGTIDILTLQMHLNDQNILNLKYLFQVRTLNVSGGGQSEVEKKKKIFEQKITPQEYELYKGSGTPNHDKLQELIRSILDPVKTKFLF